MTMVKDVVCGMEIEQGAAAASSQHEGTSYYFCSTGCKRAFDKDPAKYARR